MHKGQDQVNFEEVYHNIDQHWPVQTATINLLSTKYQNFNQTRLAAEQYSSDLLQMITLMILGCDARVRAQ